MMDLSYRNLTQTFRKKKCKINMLCQILLASFAAPKYTTQEQDCWIYKEANKQGSSALIVKLREQFYQTTCFIYGHLLKVQKKQMHTPNIIVTGDEEEATHRKGKLWHTKTDGSKMKTCFKVTRTNTKLPKYFSKLFAHESFFLSAYTQFSPFAS